MATRAESLRTLVAQFDAAAVPAEEIAKRLGISADRVEQILDQLDSGDGRPAHPDDEHRAPAVEPVRPNPAPPIEDRQPIVVGSHSRVVPSVPPKSVEVRPVPEPPADQPPYDEGGTLVPGAARLLPVVEATLTASLDDAAEPKSAGRGVREHGTAKGARQHWSHRETPCDPCREAYNAANRKAEPAKRTGPAPCGTQAAYKRHLRHDEKPCDACAEAHSGYMKSYRDKPMVDMPEGAVALLTLPLSAAHLSAVADVLELAYGPDLRLTEAPGGLWVLGCAS